MISRQRQVRRQIIWIGNKGSICGFSRNKRKRIIRRGQSIFCRKSVGEELEGEVETFGNSVFCMKAFLRNQNNLGSCGKLKSSGAVRFATELARGRKTRTI